MPRAVRSNSATPMLSSSWRTAMLTAGCVMPRLSATDGMWCCSVSATKARTRRSGQHAEYRGIAHAALLDDGCEVGARALHFGVHALRAHVQRAAIFGEEHSPRPAFEQLHAKLAFELVYRARDCRLRAKQCGTRSICATLL